VVISSFERREGRNLYRVKNTTTRSTRNGYDNFVNLSLDVFGFFRELKNTHPFDSLACVKGGSSE